VENVVGRKREQISRYENTAENCSDTFNQKLKRD
jgi:hypothetical protein